MADELKFEILPRYVPEGKDDSVEVVVAIRPEITVEIHRYQQIPVTYP